MVGQVMTYPGASAPVGSVRGVSGYGQITEISYSTRYELGFGGEDIATWTLQPLGNYYGGLAKPGDPITIWVGAAMCWMGQFVENTPQEDGSIVCQARGYAYDLFDYPADYFQSIPSAPDLMYPTTDIDEAWDRVLVAEPSFKIIGDIPTGVIEGDMPIGNVGPPVAKKPLSLGALLTATQQKVDEKWAVWGQTLFLGPDATTATWDFDAADNLVGVADTEYLTKVKVWYQAADPVDDQTDYQYAQGTSPGLFDERIAIADYRPLGLLSLSDANAYAASIMSQSRGRYIFTGGFTFEVDFASRQPVGTKLPHLVRAGTKVRIPEMRNSQGRYMPESENQFIIGRTDFTWSAADQKASVRCTPMGAVARDLGRLLEPPIPADGVADVVGT